MFFYLTADTIGTQTGGGIVTKHESDALRELGYTTIWHRPDLSGGDSPWGWDEVACNKLKDLPDFKPILTHIYSGSFPKTAALLKQRGSKLVWTVAAHDREVSKREHEKLGLEFPYPHLTEPELWSRYIDGYRQADLIIAPGLAPKNTIENYGQEFKNKVTIIPHGADKPDHVAPLPDKFTVGYAGAFGPDKGVRYLLEAWKMLAYRDATLVLAGRDSTEQSAFYFINTFRGGNIICRGWMDDLSDFYNSLSLYVQPSATEGFGIEVVEALAHRRQVVCSYGAGAAYLIQPKYRVEACNSKELAEVIDGFKKDPQPYDASTIDFQWSTVRRMYQLVWNKELGK